MKGDTRFRADCCCCCGHGVPTELLKRYAKEIPKVELHVHIEGTIRNRLAREILRENGLAVSSRLQQSSTSSEGSYSHGSTASCTEFSSSSSETELHDGALETARPATEAPISDNHRSTFGDKGELVSLVRNTAESKPTSSGVPAAQAIKKENARQQDGAKTTDTRSDAEKLQEPPRSVTRQSRRAGRRNERHGSEANEQPPTGRIYPRTYRKGSAEGPSAHKHYSAKEYHEDLWRRDPEFSAQWGRVRRVTPYLKSRRLHIYPSFQAFILDYMDRTYMLRKAENYRRILLAYLESAAADNVRHVEFHFAHFPEATISWREQLQELNKACTEAERRWGITTKRILGIRRCRSVEEHMMFLKEAEDVLPMIDAVGLVSTETGNENKKFKQVFDIAKSKGLHCVAHAGEEGPASNIRDAILYNHAERIDHGTAAVEDEELLLDLIRTKMPLTVCPLSNVCLGACRGVEEHPLLKCRPHCALLQRNERGKEAEEHTDANKDKREESVEGQQEENEEAQQGQKQAGGGVSDFTDCIITGSRINRQYPGLIDRGLQVTINSDDPAFFGGGVYNNFRAIIETNRYSEQQRQPTGAERARKLAGEERRCEDVHAATAPQGGGDLTTAKRVGVVVGGTADNCVPAAAAAAITGDAVAVGENRGISASCTCKPVETHERNGVSAAAGRSFACCSASGGGADSCRIKASKEEQGMGDRKALTTCSVECTASTAAAPIGQSSNSSRKSGESGTAGPPLLQESLHWRLDTVKQVVINGVEASFLTTAEKQRLLDEIEVFDRRFRRRHSIGPRSSGRTCKQATAAAPNLPQESKCC